MLHAQNSAACTVMVHHLSGPVMAIPAASAGVLPSKSPCGRMKLWYMISKCSRDLVSGYQGVYRIRNTQQAEKDQLQIHAKADTTDTGQLGWPQVYHPRRIRRGQQTRLATHAVGARIWRRTLEYILRSRSKLGIVLHTAACFYD